MTQASDAAGGLLEPAVTEGLRPIQPILIALLAVALLLYLRVLKSRLIGRLLIVFVFGSGVALVLVPELAMDVARAVGVGRGVDLIFYLGLLGTGLLLIVVYARLRACELQITRLARELAIAEARRPR